MAWLDLPEKQKRKKSKTKEKDLRDAYHAYRPLRNVYLSKNPLCELCMDEKVVNEDGTTRMLVRAAQEVHHKKPILTGKNREEMLKIATDMNNLQALCKWHHLYQHGHCPDPRFII